MINTGYFKRQIKADNVIMFMDDFILQVWIGPTVQFTKTTQIYSLTMVDTFHQTIAMVWFYSSLIDRNFDFAGYAKQKKGSL